MPLRIFPVAGGAVYSSSFGAARPGGRAHEGNDLMAPDDTPLLAVDDGQVRFGTDPLGENVANLIGTDNTRYYYAHLSAFEGDSRPVTAGEIIGYVGRTGNAASTDPHVHFEVHPNRGAAVDPFPPLRAASIRSASEGAARGRLSPLTTVLLAGLAAGGIYLLLNPAEARRAWRWLPG